MNDSQIVDLYWSRDDNAIAQTSKKYGGYCYAIAFRMLAEARDAEECVNDTWLGAWNAMPVHRPQYLPAFLGKITRRLALNIYKARQAVKRGGGELPLALDELRFCVPESPSAAQAAEDAALERLVNQFLHSLPARDCNIFLRRYWYVESIAEIAGRYRLNPNTVKSSLYRSREKLKRFLEKEGVAL